MKKLDINSLNSQWKLVQDGQSTKTDKAIRISSSCIPDLYLAINNDRQRSFLLYFSAEDNLSSKSIVKENLSLNVHAEKNILELKLNQLEFHDLFDDLIISIYNRISAISESRTACDLFITSFHKWASLFEKKVPQQLSKEQIKGLFGELFYLKETLLPSNSNDVDGILQGWQGPFHANNDFVYDAKNIEVKAKSETQNIVHIASEFQLQSEVGKGLELFVITLKSVYESGQSLVDITTQIISEIKDRSGDISIFYKALNELGLNLDSMKQYNNHMFETLKTQVFDAANELFPKLSNSNIPKGISKLKYDLAISTLSEFLLTEKKH
jgi:hypothetical protein